MRLPGGDSGAERPLAWGLTLPGLMGLMGSLVILLVVLVGVANWVRQSGKERITRGTLETLSRALAEFERAKGVFPQAVSSNSQLLGQLEEVEASRKVLADLGEHVYRDTAGGKEILDGWARPVRYSVEGSGPRRGRVFSDGPDEQNRADDIYAEGLGPLLPGASGR